MHANIWNWLFLCFFRPLWRSIIWLQSFILVFVFKDWKLFVVDHGGLWILKQFCLFTFANCYKQPSHPPRFHGYFSLWFGKSPGNEFILHFCDSSYQDDTVFVNTQNPITDVVLQQKIFFLRFFCIYKIINLDSTPVLIGQMTLAMWLAVFKLWKFTVSWKKKVYISDLYIVFFYSELENYDFIKEIKHVLRAIIVR